jgi:hypothetical protein
MHKVGRGALDILLRMVIRDITRQENSSREVRENLRLDIANDNFTSGIAAQFDSVEVTPGELCMFFLDRMITTANS